MQCIMLASNIFWDNPINSVRLLTHFKQECFLVWSALNAQ